MKEKVPLFAVPWCCVLPVIISFFGLGSVAIGSFLMQLLPLFILISVVLMSYANYNVYFSSHKIAKHGKIWVGINTIIAILLWVWSFNRMGFI